MLIGATDLCLSIELHMVSTDNTVISTTVLLSTAVLVSITAHVSIMHMDLMAIMPHNPVRGAIRGAVTGTLIGAHLSL
ncbi:unnamed protein product [Strongylus vulgaris]|uniref:Uncharacterized protein n=1 Tax=Strongylus vulgaris TaxID=40348 RepID=A0A3P7INZ0_STRVU|nr:unnamed protein product [Strongylus vulgaris]